VQLLHTPPLVPQSVLAVPARHVVPEQQPVGQLDALQAAAAQAPAMH
jgi:hypothetical protein